MKKSLPIVRYIAGYAALACLFIALDAHAAAFLAVPSLLVVSVVRELELSAQYRFPAALVMYASLVTYLVIASLTLSQMSALENGTSLYQQGLIYSLAEYFQ
ncbi:MAG: hypothetical protein GJ680_07595 [Alteromonadaceae bacterium]|nr:hypothetical protein [Alteromonadaceae bacterium]